MIRQQFLGLLVLFALLRLAPSQVTENCEAKADILFIMDSSGSIGDQYPVMLSFIANLTQAFNLGPNAIQVGAILFGYDAHPLFNFSAYTNHSSLEDAILNATFLAEGTYTHLALSYARLNAFTRAFGSRPSIAHIAIVLTDGQSQVPTETAKEAKLLKDIGVLVLTIGVGLNLNLVELATIASSPEDQFQVNNFNILHTISSQVTNKTCQEVVTPPKQVLACEGAADILLIISSPKVLDTNYRNMLDFAINITSSYNIGPNSVQFAAMSYGDTAKLEFDFKRFTDNVALAQSLVALSNLGLGEHVEAALTLARESAFTPANGARLNVPWIALVLADNSFSDPQAATTQAQLLRNSGVTVIPIGIGINISASELGTIASGPTDVITIDSFSNSEETHHDTTNKTCKQVVTPIKDYSKCDGVSQQADIVYVLDGSQSVGDINFNRMLSYVANFTHKFKFGPNDVRFAGIVYGDNANIVFALNKFPTANDLYAGIINTKPVGGGGSYTGKALEMVRTQVFTSANGSRPGVPKVAIVFTDGASSDMANTSSQAALLRSDGILTISIGIGQAVNQTELLDIASSPENALQVTSFDLFSVIDRQVTVKTCVEVTIPEDAAPCVAMADILFIIDSSGSITEVNYNKMLQFVANLTHSFKLGPTAVQFASVIYSDDAAPGFDFTTFTDHAALEKGILTTPYLSGNTYTDKALQLAREQIFTSVGGSRPGIPKVAIILTDGQSSNPTATMTQARLLKNSGALIISIGIGDFVNRQELDAIASLPHDVFQAASFDVLNVIENDVTNKTCERATEEVPKCPAVADILIIMDSTGSIGIDNYNLMLKFLVNFTRSFAIGQNWVQFSVITFGDSAHSEFAFNSYTSHAELEKAILNSSYLGETTQTDLALEMARELSFTAQNGARSGVDKIAIVLTDGRSNDPDLTAQQAKQLKDSGVLVLAVAIGLDILNKELSSIATLPEDIFHVEHFDALGFIEDEFSKQTCDRVSLTIECEARADILFIVDSSASIMDVNYAKMLNFIANLTKNFDLGPNAVQFGAIIFGDDAHFEFDFGHYRNHPSLEQGILGISYLSQNTFTNVALMKARLEAFTPAHGARGNVSKIAIVLTDGQSSLPTETSREAQLLKESGVLILSVGIGDTVKISELETIASLPEDVFRVDNFNVLSTIQKSLTNKTCDKGTGTQASVCSKLTDIIFLLDSSGSISSEEYQQELMFAANFTDSFQVGPENALFGAIIFSDTVSKLFDLKDFTDHWSILQSLTTAPHLKGGTNTAQALDFIYNQGVFGTAGGGRNNATKMLVIMTDGQSANISQSVASADRLKNAGVQIITIGIGEVVKMDELSSLATSPSDVFQAASFNVLNELQNDITNHTCNFTRPSTSVVHRACSEMVDVIFVIDSSSSISEDEYIKQLLFASNLTQEFDIGPVDARFATIVFSNDVFKVFDLNTFSSYFQLYQNLMGSPHLTGTADIGKALNWVTDMQMFSSAFGGRFNASKIVVLFSDNPSSDPPGAISAADRLKKDGVHITAIGVNNYDLFELRELASSAESAFKATSVDSLHWIQNDIVDDICDYASRTS